MATPEEEQKINNILNERVGINEQLLNDQQDISNVILDQVKGIEFAKVEQTSLRSITRDLAKIAQENYSLTLKELGSQKNINKLQKDKEKAEKNISKLLQIQVKELTKDKDLQKAIQDSIDFQVKKSKEFVDSLDDQIEKSQQLADNLGVKTFGALEDIVGAIPGLRKFSGPFKEAANSAKLTALSSKSSSKAFAAGAKSLGRAALAALPLLALKSLADAFISVDKSSGELAKNLGISYDESLAMVSSMTDVANLSMDTFVTTEGLVKAQQALSSALGTNAQLSSNLLVDFTKLTEQAEYSAEAATTLGKVSLATGKPVKDITTQFLGQAKALNLQNDLALNEKQLLESVSKVSKGTLATFASQPGKLAEAVFQAKKLGLEISQLEKIADGLLDIESSLANEFEAEVISGKELNLERARYFALTNNLAGVAEELSNQGYSQQEFADATRIEQEAVAKAMGMSADELGAMLIEQKALSSIGAKDGKEAKEKFETLKAQHGEAYAIANLGDETYAQQLASQSVQENFNKILKKSKELFVSIAGPVMKIVTPFVEMLIPAFEMLSYILIPIKATFEGIASSIGYIADSVSGFYNLLTGANTELSLMQSIVGAITISYGLITAYNQASALYATIRSKMEGKTVGSLIKQGFVMVKNLGLAIAEAVAKISGASAATLGIAGGIALAAGAAAYAFLSTKGDDILSPGGSSSGYGNRTLLGPEGAIALNNKDTVIAGTNLFPKDKSSERNAPTNVTVTLSKNDIQLIANAVRDGASRATINLDGDRVSSRLQTPTILNNLPPV